MTMKKIVQLGCGTVGEPVIRSLLERGQELGVELVRVLVKDMDKERPGPRELYTNDPSEIFSQRFDVLVAAMGGDDWLELELVTQALRHGRSVVLANKRILADNWNTLANLCNGTQGVYGEATVLGGIPIYSSLQASARADKIWRIGGILNGTTNWVLSQMERHGGEIEDYLPRAQKLGFAELDPENDLSGGDAASKMEILARLAFNVRVSMGGADVTGICDNGNKHNRVTQRDFEYARNMKCTIKLLAMAERKGDAIDAWVGPALVPFDHPLASVQDEMNCCMVSGELLGDLYFQGPGAGGKPTAASVLTDIITATQDHYGSNRLPKLESATLVTPSEQCADWYLRHAVADVPGVLMDVGRACDDHNISCLAYGQNGENRWRDVEGGPVMCETPLVTHSCSFAAFHDAIADISSQHYFVYSGKVMRRMFVPEPKVTTKT